MSSVPDSAGEVQLPSPVVYALGLRGLAGPSRFWHPLRDRAAGLTYCGLRAPWGTFSTIPPALADLCAVCARVQQRGALRAGGTVVLVAALGGPAPWAVGTHDSLPWLRSLREAREARYRLRPGGRGFWRSLLRRRRGR